MEDKALIDKLIGADLINSADGAKLLNEASFSHKGVDVLILEKKLVDEADLIKIKSDLIGVPYKKVNPAEITEDLMRALPQETVVNYKVIPLSLDKNLLVVGMVNPKDRGAQEALKFLANQKKLSMGVFLITKSDYEVVARRYSPFSGQVENALRNLQIKPGEGMGGAKKVSIDEAQAVSEDAPIIKIVSSMLKEAVTRGASDIHVEPQKNKLRIRFRIDGDLEEVQSLPPELLQPIISRLKILSNLKIDENRVPQDGRFRTEVYGREIDFRVATFPTPAGEKMALRVLDPEIGLKSLEALGLVGQSLAIVDRGIIKPYGMILLTGPTGSGKTTTLYALMQRLNKDNVNIVSLEDPVEYSISGINQSQVRPEIGYDFASGLRQILRQDPDVMMVGEIRDSETAELAVHSSLTGHLVLSTLHTNNSLGVIPRLIDMKIEPFLLPSVLNLMISQRLVSKLCDSCKRKIPATEAVNQMIRKEISLLPEATRKNLPYKEPYTIYEAPGCKVCKGKGRTGRLGIFEVLEMTSELSNIVSESISETKIKEVAKSQGMITLRQDGILKSLDGLISLDEVIRETNSSWE